MGLSVAGILGAMEMKYNYVFFLTGFRLYKYMYQEMQKMENVKIFWEKEDLLDMLPLFYKKTSRIYLSHKLNRIINMPNKKRWYEFAMRRIEFKNNLPICFVWHYNFYKEMKAGMLQDIKSIYPNARHVFMFSDPVFIEEKVIAELRKEVDIISVFDPKAAEKYNLLFLPNIYPMIESKSSDSEYDLCFVGTERGRENEIIEMARACKEHSIKAKFVVHTKDYGKREIENDFNIEYIRSKIPYEEVKRLVERSKCILELKIEPFNTCSLRVQEAVILKKKILTNNPNIYQMPCCAEGSRGVAVYNKIDEINWDFLKSKEEIDYNYDGEYSAKSLMKRIEDALEKKSGAG